MLPCAHRAAGLSGSGSPPGGFCVGPCRCAPQAPASQPPLCVAERKSIQFCLFML